ncbi:nicotinamidase-related amidase [Pseudomonas sp. W4I3]|nr:nicotinamidase-related amidase [Pseudomonas sp. W4I3]
MSTPTYSRLNKDDAIVLLVDHQTGLISLVQDFSPNEFKNNVLALADLAKFFNLPTILTTSFEQGPNGPLVPELKEMFPDAPVYRPPWPDQCLGQRRLRQGDQGHRPQADHHCRRGNGCVRSVPDLVGAGGRV